MAGRLTWWAMPAAIVVLVRVVTLDPAQPRQPAPSPPRPAAVASATLPLPAIGPVIGPVIVTDASGVRRGPLLLPTDTALILRLPAAAAGCRVRLALRRYDADGAPQPWVEATPRVRDDATLPMLGLPAGDYAAVIEWAAADRPWRIERDVVAPGTAELR